MIAVLFVLVATVIGVGLMVFAHVDGGYVLLGWGDWTLETSLVALVVCIVIVVALLYSLTRAGGVAARLPGRLRDGIRRRRGERARRSFEAGFLHLLQGDWKAAERELLRHASDRETPHLNYLAAAQAAQHLGAGDRRDHYLGLAADKAPHRDLKIAALATRAQLQRERGEYAALADTARALRKEDEGNLFAVELLADALVAQGEWTALTALLEEPAARGMDPQRRDPLRERAFKAGMHAAIAAGKLDELKRLWRDAGDRAERPAARLVYVEGLVRLGDEAEAQAVITQALDRGWDADLAGVYARLRAPDAMARLAAAEVWLQRYGEHAELLAAAGRACLDTRLWGKAGSYLEALLRLAPSPQVYLDLARLAESTERPDDAARYYRKGLVLAAGGAHRARRPEADPTPV